MAASVFEAAVAVTRLGLGARPGEIDRVAADPRGWALGQIRAEGAPQPSGAAVSTAERMEAFLAYQASGTGRREAAAPAGAIRRPRPRVRPGRRRGAPSPRTRVAAFWIGCVWAWRPTRGSPSAGPCSGPTP
ncbi:hypothetical protein [Brevundimonas aurantiaca]|uniref:hypothetical protein n=1 Tax=Brevundimonas aurantiaca TaxID=74316 RepID=UPI001CD6CAE5|nr:hypothetical protein [Brevundimonas aurantiaca]